MQKAKYLSCSKFALKLVISQGGQVLVPVSVQCTSLGKNFEAKTSLEKLEGEGSIGGGYWVIQ